MTREDRIQENLDEIMANKEDYRRRIGKLVSRQLKEAQGLHPNVSFARDDLMQRGWEALLKAAERYDVDYESEGAEADGEVTAVSDIEFVEADEESLPKAKLFTYASSSIWWAVDDEIHFQLNASGVTNRKWRADISLDADNGLAETLPMEEELTGDGEDVNKIAFLREKMEGLSDVERACLYVSYGIGYERTTNPMKIAKQLKLNPADVRRAVESGKRKLTALIAESEAANGTLDGNEV